MSAVIEKTLSVSGVDAFTVAVRSRTPARPEPTISLVPDEVVLAYAFRAGDWVLSGVEVYGVRAPGSPHAGEEALVRFTPGVHDDMPPWVVSLARSYLPVNPPG